MNVIEKVKKIKRKKKILLKYEDKGASYYSKNTSSFSVRTVSDNIISTFLCSIPLYLILIFSLPSVFYNDILIYLPFFVFIVWGISFFNYKKYLRIKKKTENFNLKIKRKLSKIENELDLVYKNTTKRDLIEIKRFIETNATVEDVEISKKIISSYKDSIENSKEYIKNEIEDLIEEDHLLINS
tara:strand:+ start:30836 stop:31387 length:552 start_codon:yes stop_codon:yes gene_type:complete